MAKISATGMKCLRWVGLLLCAAGATGCASTEMSSFVDPEFKDCTYHNLMVYAISSNLDERDEIETLFVQKLAHPKLACVRALDIVPPTRAIDDDESEEAIRKAGVDGALVVCLTQYYEDQYYVQPSTTSHTTGNVNAYGQMNATTYSHSSGGYNIPMPRARHEVTLVDGKTGKKAWIGGAFSEGSIYSSGRQLMESLATEVGKALQKEGLVEPPQKK